MSVTLSWLLPDPPPAVFAVTTTYRPSTCALLSEVDASAVTVSPVDEILLSLAVTTFVPSERLTATLALMVRLPVPVF
jgi:hypothetical protein